MIVLFAVSWSTWAWMLHAWSTPTTYRRTGGDFHLLFHEPCFSFSLIVPARNEETVLAATLDRLAILDHPYYEVIAVVGDDDAPTRQVAEAAAERHPQRIRVIVDTSVPKNKPQALNAGLAACRNEIVGIFDAEDDVSLDVLRQADDVFERTGAEVAQGGVQLVTLRNSWFSARNCLEYFFWFRSRLHVHAEHGLAPLGGNTVFFRRDALLRTGGWDGTILAEDCDIGIRLSASGSDVAVWFDAHTATREETPATLRAFIKQRTRWNQGYIQVLRKRSWKVLPTRRQRALVQYVLVFPLIQAATGFLFPAAILLVIFGQLPLLLTLAAFVPLLIMVGIVATELVGLFELSRTFHLGAGLRDYAVVVLTTIPYQLILAFAATRAIWREALGRRGWEKTEHAGLHRTPVALLPIGET